MQYLKGIQESPHWENKMWMKRWRRWRVGQAVTWWREFQAEGVSKCKGSKTGMCLKYLRNSKEASMAGIDWANWRWVDEIREIEGSMKCWPLIRLQKDMGSIPILPEMWQDTATCKMILLVALLGRGCRTNSKGRLCKTSWGTITESRQEVTTIQSRRVAEAVRRRCTIRDLF